MLHGMQATGFGLTFLDAAGTIVRIERLIDLRLAAIQG